VTVGQDAQFSVNKQSVDNTIVYQKAANAKLAITLQF